jgi:hypothetical protein
MLAVGRRGRAWPRLCELFIYVDLIIKNINIFIER